MTHTYFKSHLSSNYVHPQVGRTLRWVLPVPLHDIEVWFMMYVLVGDEVIINYKPMLSPYCLQKEKLDRVLEQATEKLAEHDTFFQSQVQEYNRRLNERKEVSSSDVCFNSL